MSTAAWLEFQSEEERPGFPHRGGASRPGQGTDCCPPDAYGRNETELIRSYDTCSCSRVWMALDSLDTATAILTMQGLGIRLSLSTMRVHAHRKCVAQLEQSEIPVRKSAVPARQGHMTHILERHMPDFCLGNGSPGKGGALLRRPPLRTARATHRGIRLRQAAGASRFAVLTPWAGGLSVPDSTRCVRGVFYYRPVSPVPRDA
jgi:hypothetical protein